MRVRLAILLTCCAAIVTACGGGDGSSDSSDGDSTGSLTAQPTAKQPISSQIAPFNRAIAKRDCAQVIAMTFSLDRAKPAGSPATAAECKDPHAISGGLSGNRFTRAKQYGTAALMEAPARKHWTVWVLDSDGQYRYAGLLGGPPLQIGSTFARAPLATVLTTKFLKAVREKDCAAMAPIFSHGARLVIGLHSKRAACKAVLNGRFLAPALRATAKPDVKVLGGTANVAFVGVATNKGYFTFLYNDAPKVFQLLDVLPNTGNG